MPDKLHNQPYSFLLFFRFDIQNKCIFRQECCYYLYLCCCRMISLPLGEPCHLCVCSRHLRIGTLIVGAWMSGRQIKWHRSCSHAVHLHIHMIILPVAYEQCSTDGLDSLHPHLHGHNNTRSPDCITHCFECSCITGTLSSMVYKCSICSIGTVFTPVLCI